MTISGVGNSAYSGMSYAPPPKPPSAEEVSSSIASAVSSGDMSIEDLEARLADKFGEEAVSDVIIDGELDVEALTAMVAKDMEAHQQSEESAGMQPPPPPKGSIDIESLTTQLSEMFGEEAASSIVADSGEIDFEALAQLLQSQSESSVGQLIDISA